MRCLQYVLQSGTTKDLGTAIAANAVHTYMKIFPQHVFPV